MGRLNITAVRRQQIIDATLRVLARKGWNETSIDEISREADVSRGLVSYHFGDKAALLAGVLDRCEQIFRRGGSAARDVATDPVERQRLSIRNGIIAVRDFPRSPVFRCVPARDRPCCRCRPPHGGLYGRGSAVAPRTRELRYRRGEPPERREDDELPHGRAGGPGGCGLRLTSLHFTPRLRSPHRRIAAGRGRHTHRRAP